MYETPTLAREASSKKTSPQDAWAMDWLQDPRTRQIPWEQLRNRPLSRREKTALRQFYAGHYAEDSAYTDSHPWHRERCHWRLRVAEAVLGDLGKTLDAGCSAGELIRVAKERDLDAYGFDICPDLHEVAYAEVHDRVRIGSLGRIPYSRADGFRTLVSYDVIEHCPVDELARFPSELRRLGIEQVACIISTDTISEGHITIQDTEWYRRLFASAGYRILDEFNDVLAQTPAPCGWNSATEEAIWGLYAESGKPKNGWNQAPGYLFLRYEPGK